MKNKVRYRLRIDDLVVGYMDVDKNNQSFYSKDTYGWTSQPIEHVQKDLGVGFKDKQNNWLFDTDYVEVLDKDGVRSLWQMQYKNDTWRLFCDTTLQHQSIQLDIGFFKQLRRISEA